MKPDFIKEHKAFDIFCRSHPLSADAQLLWYKLFQLFNDSFYPDELFLSNNRLGDLIDAYDVRKAAKARDELVRAGALSYSPGKKSCPGRYVLISLCGAVFKGERYEREAEYENVYRPYAPYFEAPLEPSGDMQKTGDDVYEDSSEEHSEKRTEKRTEKRDENRDGTYKEYYYNKNKKNNKNVIKNNNKKPLSRVRAKGAEDDEVTSSDFYFFDKNDFDNNGDDLNVADSGAKTAFEEFWRKYPKKTGYGRAKDAFLSADIDEETFLDIMSFIENAKDSASWNAECGRYIPSPERFIRECRWKDDLPDSAPYPASMRPPYGGEKSESSYGDVEEFFAAAVRKGLEI